MWNGTKNIGSPLELDGKMILYDLVYIPEIPFGRNNYLRTLSLSSVADYLFKSRWSKKF